MKSSLKQRLTRSNSVADSSTDSWSIDDSIDSGNFKGETENKLRPQNLDMKRYVTSLSRTNTRSAHAIRVPKAVNREEPEREFKFREEEITRRYKHLDELYNGTERQVLYRINMLIHQDDADLNSLEKDGNGNGILHYAVRNKFVTVAEKLIENGADILDENKDGNTPLHLAVGYDTLKPTETLMKKTRNWCFFRCEGKEKEEKKIVDHNKQIDMNGKCDEMAALLISKMKPFRVRELFGDTTDIDMFQDSEGFDETQSNNFGERRHRRPGKSKDVSSTSSSSSESETEEKRGNLRTEIANTKLTRKTGSGYGNVGTSKTDDHDKRTADKTANGNAANTASDKTTEGREDISKVHTLQKPFKFIDIVRDKYLQDTTCTVLDKLLDTDPKNNDTVAYIKILEDVQDMTNAFHYIAKNCPEITKHPVVRALVRHKWKKWAFRRYLLNTILYFISFFALTICAVVGAQSDHVFLYDSPWQYTRGALEILVCFFILKAVLTEVDQLRSDPIGYVKSIMNWVELSSVLLLIVTIILRYTDQNAQWFTFAVGYVLWTVKGLKYAAVTRHTAAYSETLRAIMIRDFPLFAMFFVAIEMVFGGTFLLVLKGTSSLHIEPETNTIYGIYYVGLRTMIEGGMPVDYLKYPKIAQFVAIVFMSLTIVIMLNILIAQLSNTYETAYAEGQIKSWVNRAKATAKFDQKMLIFCQKKKKVGKERLLKLPFNIEWVLEEKEKLEEMRSNLKQLDRKLIHADLTIQTVKTRLNVLLHAVYGKKRGKGDVDLDNDVGMLSRQNDLINELGEIKSILRSISSKLK